MSALHEPLTRRRLLQFSAAAGAAGLLGAAAPEYAAGAGSAVTLRHLNYVNWIGKNEYKNFAAETGITVKQVVANSSDDRVAKLQSDPRAADFVLADLVLGGRIDGLGLVGKLDLAKIPNYKLVSPSFKIGLASPQVGKLIPTDFGRSGILYRKDLMTDPPTSWADFFRLAPKYSGKVSMLDFPDGTMKVAVIASGFNGNTRSKSQVEKAADLLIKVKPHVRAFISSDEAKPLLDGTAVMGQVEDWAAAAAVSENPNLRWVDPLDGIHAYLEGWVAMKSTSHLDEVQSFMNYHLRPRVTANFANTLSIGSITSSAEKYVLPKLKKNPVTYPPRAVYKRAVFARYLGEAQKNWDEAWARFKSA